MATGRAIQLTKQLPENVDAIRPRRPSSAGDEALAHSVPDYDIIAIDPSFRSVPVLVTKFGGEVGKSQPVWLPPATGRVGRFAKMLY